jgi:hypothetical protein
MSERALVAKALMERGTDFALLRQWAELNRDTLLNDLCGADPNKPGDLASLRGRAVELTAWLNLETRVKQAASDP